MQDGERCAHGRSLLHQPDRADRTWRIVRRHIGRAEREVAGCFRRDIRAMDPLRHPLRRFGGRLGPIRRRWHDMDDLVAARLQLLKDHGQGRLGSGLNIVQQQHAFAFGL